MVCKYCGKSFNNNKSVCPNCGRAVEKQSGNGFWDIVNSDHEQQAEEQNTVRTQQMKDLPSVKLSPSAAKEDCLAPEKKQKSNKLKVLCLISVPLCILFMFITLVLSIVNVNTNTQLKNTRSCLADRKEEIEYLMIDIDKLEKKLEAQNDEETHSGETEEKQDSDISDDTEGSVSKYIIHTIVTQEDRTSGEDKAEDDNNKIEEMPETKSGKEEKARRSK